MAAKQIVQSHYPDAIIRRCTTAFDRGVEFRVTWDRDGKGNYKQTIGKNPSEAWVSAKNLIEEKQNEQ